MPRLPVISPKLAIRKFKKLGFVEDHTTGSHVVMYHPDGRRAVIPYHLRDIPKGTLVSILREAKVSREEFLRA